MPALIQFASGAPGIKYQIDQRYFSIGRDTAENDVCLPCAFVSKHHAYIEVVEEEDGYAFYLQDLDSTNHTYVNDRAVVRTRLQDGDIIRIGKNSLKFEASGVLPVLDAVELDFELPDPDESQTRTWNFSRRLRLIAAEEA